MDTESLTSRGRTADPTIDLMDNLPKREQSVVNFLSHRNAQHTTPQPKGSAHHPRSRGVYTGTGEPSTSAHGSSPLARGLRRRHGRVPDEGRIIPARAGFTTGYHSKSSQFQDHPRSRGVYIPCIQIKKNLTGSSPLARGLLGVTYRARCGSRIIPARTGFTPPGRRW